MEDSLGSFHSVEVKQTLHRIVKYVIICHKQNARFGHFIVGPQVKPMPDLDIFVGAIMGKIIVLELPEPCRGDLCGFLGILSKIRVRNFAKSGLKWVHMARHGLKLWENDATDLKIILKLFV